MPVAAPCPWLLQVRGCPRSVAALLLDSWLLDSWLLDSWLLDSWLLDSWLLDFWLLDFWLLVYLRTVRHSWEQK